MAKQVSKKIKRLRKARIFKRTINRLEGIASLLTLFILIVIIVILVSPSLYFKKVNYEMGEPMLRTVEAPFRFDVIDKKATDKIKDEKVDESKRIFQYNVSVEEEAMEKIAKLFDFAEKYQNDEALDVGDRVFGLRKKINDDFGIEFSRQMTTNLLRFAEGFLFPKNVKKVIHAAMSARGVIENKNRYVTLEKDDKIELRIKDGDEDTEVAFSGKTLIEYPNEVEPFLLKHFQDKYYTRPADRERLETAAEICLSFIVPNISFLEKETLKNRRRVRKNVPNVIITYEKGSVIVKRGQDVEYIHHIALDKINSLKRAYNFLNLMCTAVFVCAFALFIAIYIRRFELEISFSPTNIILVNIPLVLALLIGRFFLEFIPGEFSGYLFPAGLIGMLGVILIGPRLALIAATCGSFLFGLSIGMDFRYIIVAFCGGFTAVTVLHTIKQRADVLKAGLIIGIVNFVAILTVNYINDPSVPKYILASWGMLNGIICYVFTISALPVFEYMFGVTTDVRLLELTGINHQLLREIEQKAPGSYQHSLNVAKLAEPAADAIGASYLLTRAGAYYHDIGKMAKPKYFSENQISQEEKNLHSKLNPNMSTLIIKKHIKDGIELAKKHHLPQKVIDFISQHHGTTLIKYFYQAALDQHAETDSPEVIKEEDFRYPGPKPEYIETAIVMLADSIEATSTSEFNKPYVTDEDIRLTVHRTIASKFNDGQLDECNLTMRQLHVIHESFINTLRSRFHHRVQYPSKEKVTQSLAKMEEKTEKLKVKGV